MKLKLISLLCAIGAGFSYPNHEPKATKYLDQPVITTPLGQIQGTILASRLGKQIYSFRGIRYAKAPIGDLRFQVNKHPKKKKSTNKPKYNNSLQWQLTNLKESIMQLTIHHCVLNRQTKIRQKIVFFLTSTLQR